MLHMILPGYDDIWATWKLLNIEAAVTTLWRQYYNDR